MSFKCFFLASLFGVAQIPAHAQESPVIDREAGKLFAVDFASCGQPAWPPGAEVRAEKGQVILTYRVDANGKVLETLVSKSTGFPALDEAAAQALRACRFTPPARFGHAEPVWAKIAINWTQAEDKLQNWNRDLALAESGDADAQYRVGIGFLYGTPKRELNVPFGMRILRTAAQQGHSKAQEALAFQLKMGSVAAADTPPVAASGTAPAVMQSMPCIHLVWPQESLDNEETGKVRMSFLVGEDGVVKDAKVLQSSGFHRLDQASLDGIRKCMFKPATENGRPVASWLEMKYVWSMEEAPPEEEQALKRLRSNDFEGAAALFRKAADQGSANAQYYLGGMLYFGYGVKQDSQEGLARLSKAAAKEHGKAQGTLASILLEQGGADQRAYELLLTAAQDDEAASMYLLGTCLENGRGTASNMGEARRWYQRAAEKGHPQAAQALARLAGAHN